MTEKEHYECRVFVSFLKKINCIYSKIANDSPNPRWRLYQSSEWLIGWVPDYIIILRCASGNRKLVFVEMKRKKGWVVSAKQKIWINALTDTWLSAYIANGAMEAIRFIQKQIAEN